MQWDLKVFKCRDVINNGVNKRQRLQKNTGVLNNDVIKEIAINFISYVPLIALRVIKQLNNVQISIIYDELKFTLCVILKSLPLFT